MARKLYTRHTLWSQLIIWAFLPFEMVRILWSNSRDLGFYLKDHLLFWVYSDSGKDWRKRINQIMRNSMCVNVTYFVSLLSNLGTKLGCRIYCYSVGFTVFWQDFSNFSCQITQLYFLWMRRDSQIIFLFWFPGSSYSVLGWRLQS